jgi:hypothetical protein
MIRHEVVLGNVDAGQGGSHMRRLLLGSLGSLLIGGLVVGSGVGTAVGRASSQRPATVSSTSSPCTSATFALTVSLAGASSGPTSISVNGQVDFVNHDLSAAVALPSSLPVPALAGTTLQILLVDGTVYVSVPPALSGFVHGDTWISLAVPAAADQVVNAVLGDLASWCGNSQSLVQALVPRNEKGAATSLGAATLNGEAATGTAFSEPAGKLAKALKLPKTLVKKGSKSFAGTRVPIEVWSNSQGRLVEVSASIQPKSALAGISGVSVTLDVSNIDQPVSITAPSGGALALSWSVLFQFVKGFLGSGGAL